MGVESFSFFSSFLDASFPLTAPPRIDIISTRTFAGTIQPTSPWASVTGALYSESL